MPALIRHLARTRQHGDAPPALCKQCTQQPAPAAKYTAVNNDGQHTPLCCDHAATFARANDLRLSAHPQPARTPRVANQAKTNPVQTNPAQPITTSRRTASNKGAN